MKKEKKNANFSASSANPRKFSRGKDGLNPEQVLYMYLQLQVIGNKEDVVAVFRLIDRYKQEWPQAEVEIVAASSDKGTLNLVISIALGEAQDALSGISEKVAASFGFLNTIVTNMYQYRPIFVPPPTERERENFYEMLSIST